MSSSPGTYDPEDSGMHGPVTPSRLPGNKVGVLGVVFMVVAGAAPLAVVGGIVPITLATSGSVASPVFFIICAVILVLFSVGFSAMSKFVPNAGAFYSYIQTGFGRVFGSGSAILAVWSYLLVLVATFFYTGGLIAATLTGYFGTSVLPWWGWSLLLVAVVGVLGYRNIALSAKVLGVLLVAETLAVVVLDVAILLQGGEGGLTLVPLNIGLIGEGGAPGLGILFAFLGFLGFEATAVFRSEAKDPERTIPRATYIAVIGIGVLYALSAYAVVEGVGVSNAVGVATEDPTGMVASLASIYVHPIMNDVIAVLLVTSFIACSLTFHNVLTRYFFTLGGTGLLPRKLSLINKRTAAPSRASLVLSILVGICMVAGIVSQLDPVLELYTWFSGASILGIVALMTLTSVAVVAFFRRNKGLERNAWKTIVAPILATIGLAGILWLIISNFGIMVGGDVVAIVFVIVMAASLIVGIIIALVIRKSNPSAWQRLDNVTVHSGVASKNVTK